MVRYTILVICAFVAPAGAVNVVIDYSYDSSGFFSTSTRRGLYARATIEEAADFFSAILEDDLVEIRKPDDYISSATGGADVTYSWDWSARFTNPYTGSTTSISNPVFAENEYRIYVGARNLPGSAIGEAGPGGYEWSAGGSYYFEWQLNEINAITEDFDELLMNRSQGPGDFGRWGGSVTFDSLTTWNYDYAASPTSGQNDLYSVAIHEIAHVFGFSTSDEFEAFRNGSNFIGPNAVVANGGTAPSLTSDSHWAYDTQSVIFGSTTPQEASLDPDVTTGTRKFFTELDAAALEDIGWEIGAAPSIPGDYNGDGMVDAADYTVWRDSFEGSVSVIGSLTEWTNNYGAVATSTAVSIPEPSSLLLMLASLAAIRRR